VVVLVVPLTFWGTEKPDVAVLSPFTPTGLVPMYDAALSHPLHNSFHCFHHRLTLYEAVQQFYYLTCRDRQLVHGVQILLDLLHSQPQGGAQVSYERGDTHAYSSLAYYLPTQI
jgi:hypothetical protein